MERPIGDRFTYCGKDYVVEDAHDYFPCGLCAFEICEEAGINKWVTCTAESVTGECRAEVRSDGKEVYFRRVE